MERHKFSIHGLVEPCRACKVELQRKNEIIICSSCSQDACINCTMKNGGDCHTCHWFKINDFQHDQLKEKSVLKLKEMARDLKIPANVYSAEISKEPIIKIILEHIEKQKQSSVQPNQKATKQSTVKTTSTTSTSSKTNYGHGSAVAATGARSGRSDTGADHSDNYNSHRTASHSSTSRNHHKTESLATWYSTGERSDVRSAENVATELSNGRSFVSSMTPKFQQPGDEYPKKNAKQQQEKTSTKTEPTKVTAGQKVNKTVPAVAEHIKQTNSSVDSLATPRKHIQQHEQEISNKNKNIESKSEDVRKSYDSEKRNGLFKVETNKDVDNRPMSEIDSNVTVNYNEHESDEEDQNTNETTEDPPDAQQKYVDAVGEAKNVSDSSSDGEKRYSVELDNSDTINNISEKLKDAPSDEVKAPESKQDYECDSENETIGQSDSVQNEDDTNGNRNQSPDKSNAEEDSKPEDEHFASQDEGHHETGTSGYSNSSNEFDGANQDGTTKPLCEDRSTENNAENPLERQEETNDNGHYNSNNKMDKANTSTTSSDEASNTGAGARDQAVDFKNENKNDNEEKTTQFNNSNTTQNVIKKEETQNKTVETISDITDVEIIKTLGIRLLKDILRTNNVNFTNFSEKSEFVKRTEQLWRDSQVTDTVVTEENLCKICRDAPMDCILLECGHIATCTECANLLTECPICRLYIIKRVRVFRT